MICMHMTRHISQSTQKLGTRLSTTSDWQKYLMIYQIASTANVDLSGMTKSVRKLVSDLVQGSANLW